MSEITSEQGDLPTKSILHQEHPKRDSFRRRGRGEGAGNKRRRTGEEVDSVAELTTLLAYSICHFPCEE